MTETMKIRNNADFQAYLIATAEALEAEAPRPVQHKVIPRREAIRAAMLVSRAKAFRDVADLVGKLTDAQKVVPQ